MMWRTVLILAFILVAMSCSEQNVTTPDDITIDFKNLGMIKGRAVVPRIGIDHHIIYEGKRGIVLKIIKLKRETKSLEGGVYAIDSLPAGGHTLTAWWPIGDHSLFCEYTSKAVVVEKQTTTEVPDWVVYDTTIIFGVARYQDGRAFSGKTLSLISSGVELDQTITSSDGRYAFYDVYQANWLKSNEGEVNVEAFGDDNYPGWFFFGDDCGLVEMNITIIP